MSESRILVSREDLEDLAVRFQVLEDQPDILLDCRALSEHYFSMLLKFIEDYKGALTLLANDPVPPPILSRFIDVEKCFTPDKGAHLIEVRMRGISGNMKSKVLRLFGIQERKNDSPEDKAGY